MSEVLKVIAVALITVFASIVIKQTKPEISIIITIAGSIIIIIMSVDALSSIVSVFYDIFNKTGVESNLLAPLFKIVAIGYIAEFGANICVDAGASGMADKVLFCGKLVILMVALPIVTTVIDMVVTML